MELNPIISTLFALMIFSSSQSQDMKLLIDEGLSSELFSSTDSIVNPDYEILEVSGYEDISEPKYKRIGSTCQVNEDELRTIHFAEGAIEGASLKIRISETNPIYHDLISIEIRDNDVEVKFEMNQSGPLLERSYSNESAEVVLQSNQLKKGDWIYGRLKYNSTMIIDGNESPISILGDFKAQIN